MRLAYADPPYPGHGAEPGDEFADLFPGSRAVTDAWAQFDGGTTHD